MTDTHEDVHLIGDEAMAVSLLTRAANAIVDASRLGKLVTVQQTELETLREAVSTLTQAKADLEWRNGELIAQRDNAQDNHAALVREMERERGEAARKVGELTGKIEEVMRENHELGNRIEGLETSLDSTREDRDEGLRQLSELSVDLGRTKVALGKLKEILHTAMEEPKAEAEPEPLSEPVPWAVPGDHMPS